MELELKHLASYLPYNLKGLSTFLGERNIYTIAPDNVMSCLGKNAGIKPILRPLSDLTKDIEVNGEKFVSIEKLDKIESDVCSYSIDYYINHTKRLPYYRVQKLLEWHFDIFGLIENNLAIDINTL